MSKAFLEFIAQDRRLCILRTLHDLNGSANESVLKTAMEALGFRRLSRDTVREDLTFLVNHGCITQEYYGDLMVVQLTRRGTDVSQGSIIIDGIKQPSIGV